MTNEASAALPLVNLRADETWQDPAAAFAPARESSPVARTRGGEWLVLGYPEIEEGLADPRMKTVGLHLMEQIGVTDGPLHEFWSLVMFNTNAPEHTRLRSLVSQAFKPRSIEALRPRMRALSDELVRKAAAGGAVDWIDEVAHPLPIRVTCELLGVPTNERDEVAAHTCEIGRAFTTVMDAPLRARCERSLESLQAIVRRLLDERRRRSADDMLTALVDAEESGSRLSERELVAMVINLLFAGHDTTRSLMSLGFSALLRSPEAFERLQESPGLVPSAVEEMLRFESPVMGSLRAPSEPVVLGGVSLAPGTVANFIFLSGNRDPRAFDDPDRFDVARYAEGRSASRPLSFGLGAHFCLGAALARAEMQELLSSVLAHCAAIELDPATGEDLRTVPYATIRQLEAMPVVVEGR